MFVKTGLPAIFYGFSILSYISGQKIEIRPSGEQIKAAGSGFVLTCSFSGGGGGVPEMAWRSPYGDLILDSNGRVHVERDRPRQLRLFISSVGPVDAGTYQCSGSLPADGSDTSATSATANSSVVLYEKIRFVDGPTSLTQRVFSEPLLPCRATGKPKPRISWRFKRNRLEDGEKYSITADGLRIANLAPADNGTYECRGEVSSYGTLEIRKISLEVLYPPELHVAPEDLNVKAGSRLELRCEATGNPAVEYEWMKEETLSKDVTMRAKIGQGPSHTKHVINKVEPRDAGKYYCTVSNDIGAVTVSAEIGVYVPPRIDGMTSRNQSSGDILMLPCRATGNPTPLIWWSRVHKGKREEYRPRAQTRNGNANVVDGAQPGEAHFIIRGVFDKDSGVYTCHAENAAGTAERNVTVIVQYAPTITSSYQQLLAWPGQTRQFNCSSKGEPVPDVTWARGSHHHYLSSEMQGYVIKGNQGTSILQVTASRNRPYIYGSYTCRAKNRMGMVTKDFLLEQAAVPAQPSNVTVVEETAYDVTLSAQAQSHVDGLPVTRWRLKYAALRVHNSSEERDAKAYFFDFDEKIHIRKLRPGTRYNFSLSAGNEVGFSSAVKFVVETRPVRPEPGDEGAGNQHARDRLVPRESRARQTENVPAFPVTFMIGIISGVVLLSIVLFAALIAARRRRKSPPQTPPAADVTAEAAAAEILLQRRPQLCVLDNRASVDSVPGLNIPETDPNSAQRLAWDAMLEKQALEPPRDEEPSFRHVDEFSPDMDLPPPPDFLLETSAATVAPTSTSEDIATAVDSYCAALDEYCNERRQRSVS